MFEPHRKTDLQSSLVVASMRGGTAGGQEVAVVDNPKMQFVLRGFSHAMGFRVFAFEGIAADRKRSMFTVKADMALTRKYGIHLQELPLLCRAVLEQCHGGGEDRAFLYSEESMRRHAEDVAARAEAARQRKAPRRVSGEHIGAAWRVSPR